MGIPTIAFLKNENGLGTTSPFCHVAWMISELGLRVLAADEKDTIEDGYSTDMTDRNHSQL